MAADAGRVLANLEALRALTGDEMGGAIAGGVDADVAEGSGVVYGAGGRAAASGVD